MSIVVKTNTFRLDNKIVSGSNITVELDGQKVTVRPDEREKAWNGLGQVAKSRMIYQEVAAGLRGKSLETVKADNDKKTALKILKRALKNLEKTTTFKNV